jgi:hypothetical protein
VLERLCIMNNQPYKHKQKTAPLRAVFLFYELSCITTIMLWLFLPIAIGTLVGLEKPSKVDRQLPTYVISTSVRRNR